MSDTAPFHPLTTTNDLEAALARAEDEPIVFYKHSATCSLSTRTQREVATLDRASDPPVYRVVVQKARAVSNAIAERFAVRHESPQVLVIHDDTVLHDASHTRIALDDIRTASTDLAWE